MHTKQSSFTDLPKSLSIVKTYDTIQASFPGSQDPARLVVKADDVTTPQFADGLCGVQAARPGNRCDPRSRSASSVNKAKTVARIDFPLAGEGHDARRCALSRRCAHEVIPPVLATLPAGTEQAVTGRRPPPMSTSTRR